MRASVKVDRLGAAPIRLTIADNGDPRYRVQHADNGLGPSEAWGYLSPEDADLLLVAAQVGVRTRGAAAGT